ncbi:hypothetical protein [Flavobacterium sp. JP2137]|uniref:hypothetical protein n=1 Tax=Flavobacterium sp. JP2137 TaxID=3414510 RepID=UPI003D2FEF81
MLERIITLLLSNVFEIDDIENSNSFQTTANVLSFYAKTSILSDLRVEKSIYKEMADATGQIGF